MPGIVKTNMTVPRGLSISIGLTQIGELRLAFKLLKTTIKGYFVTRKFNRASRQYDKFKDEVFKLQYEFVIMAEQARNQK